MATKQQRNEIEKDLNSLTDRLHEIVLKYNIPYVTLSSLDSKGSKEQATWAHYKLNNRTKSQDTKWIRTPRGTKKAIKGAKNGHQRFNNYK